MTPGHTLLVVEDEKNVGTTLVERLRKEGFQVAWAISMKEALQLAARQPFDLLLLDVGLPDGDGFQIAEKVRASSPSSAIIFLTAFGNPEDRIRGLELGAEDYIVKPFHLKELLLRIGNVLKRGQAVLSVPGADSEIRVGRARVRFSKFEIEVDGGGVHTLTHKEFAVLKLLVTRRGTVVSRDDILNEAWAEGEFPSTRTIDNFILRLRRLVEIDPENPSVIRSIRGVGYQLTLSDSEERSMKS
jgi:DNA-binding response OmpR family regulator